ncbi:MAG: trigger factor [Campylobacteraceae bacterium 4484_166]|nr:MAG: trigger factor [Campylobacteraceae bacterium 4484_166]
MQYKLNKINSSNIEVFATIEKQNIDKNVDKMAREASKTMDIQGFRKGKVPLAVVKQRYGKKLEDDATNESLKELFDQVLKDEKLKFDDLTGEPSIPKFDKKEDNSIEIQMNLYLKPVIDLGDYKQYIPELTPIKISEKEINDRLKTISQDHAPMEDIKTPRELKDGDFAVIDFKGFKDDKPFDGGEATNYTLKIGSNTFVPGFEEQLIGMKYMEKKDIKVKFPQNYQSKELADADVIFEVQLKKIQQKGETKLDDEFAKKILSNKKDATLDMLKDEIKEQIKSEKRNEYFMHEIKPQYTKLLVENYEFDIPENIVQNEINQQINKKLSSMSEDEIKDIQKDPKFVDKLKDDLKDVARQSVKATFLIDSIAKNEKIKVSDEQVNQTIYYEAMMSGQDGKELITQYEKKGYLPAVKLSMIEQQLMMKLFDEKMEQK